MGTVLGGVLMLPATPDVLASFVAEAEHAPDELSLIANVMPAPPTPMVPSEHHGRPMIFAMLVHAGDPGAGERAVAPFRSLAKPIADLARPMPYPEIYRLTEGAPHPVAFAFRSMFLDVVERRAAETVVDSLVASTAPMRVAQLRVLGGVMARVPAEDTAFAHRRRRIMVNVAALFERRYDPTNLFRLNQNIPPAEPRADARERSSTNQRAG